MSPLSRSIRARGALLLLALLATVSCSDDSDPVAPPVLTTLTVTLPATSIQAGTTTTATVAGRDQNGATIATGTVTWSTASPAVATVSGDGIVTGVGPGSAAIIATAAGKAGQATITVTAPPPVLTTLNVTLPAASITLGQTTTASAAGLDQNGAAIATGATAWTSSAPAVATVNATTGVVTGVSAGTAQITVTAGTRTGQRLITVTAPPAIRINEVESNGGTPGDWVELYNATTSAVDLSNWIFRDNDNTREYRLPAGTSIAAGGYLVLEEAAFGFGLGAAEDARVFNPFGALVDTYTWTAHAALTYGRCPNGTGAFGNSAASTKGVANDCRPLVRINEVESNGGTPGDWIELFNAGTVAVDLSGFVVKDNDDTRTTALPAGTVIAPGAFLVIEETTLGFGLGAADAARLFDLSGAIVDTYTWTAHAALTYGRCPDGTGDFASTSSSTKGAANVCAPVGPAIGVWPGSDDVTTVDGVSVFNTNLSGLTYEGAAAGRPAVLWAVRNGPGTLYRLIFNGSIWTPDPANGWSAGKPLRYTNGTGNPDSEGVTFAAGGSAAGIYVATERNNDASTISRSSILRFDPASSDTALRATNDWNLTSDLPVVGANLGIEAVTWLPDSFLVAKGFFDETASKAYVPADYPNHGTGLFFVGVEGNGIIYVYALDHVTNGVRRIASFATGNPGVMALEFDRETGYLWSTCDDTCGNKAAILEIETAAGAANRGRFRAPREFAKPSTLPNINNEGFAFAPQSECVNNRKPVFWADDNETAGHSIRRATISCGTVSAVAGARAFLQLRER